MGITCVIDVSLSMLTNRCPNGNGEEVTNYMAAVEMLCRLLQEARKMECGQEICIYRGSQKLKESQSDDVQKALVGNDSLDGALSMGDFFKQLFADECIKTHDTILIFTDGKTYKADLCHYPPCNVRFVVVTSDPAQTSAIQLKELSDVSRTSLDDVNSVVAKWNFDCLLRSKMDCDEIISALLKNHFLPEALTLWLGYFSQRFKLTPFAPEIPAGDLFIIGFLKSMNMMNAPTLSHHRVILVPHDVDTPSLIQKARTDLKRTLENEDLSEGGDTQMSATEASDKSGDAKIIKKEADTSLTIEDVDSDEEKSERPAKREKSEKKRKSNDGFMVRRLRVIRRMRTRPMLIEMLADNLVEEEMVAICRYRTGQYAVLHSVAYEDAEPSLFLSILPKELHDFQPSFDDLISESILTDTNESKDITDSDLHIIEKAGSASYEANYQCWTTSQGINNDVQKLIRMMKKLPDKHVQFYQEVNKFRDYAILLGMMDFLKEIGRVFKNEAASISETAQRHAKHIAHWFAKDIDPSNYVEIPVL